LHTHLDVNSEEKRFECRTLCALNLKTNIRRMNFNAFHFKIRITMIIFLKKTSKGLGYSCMGVHGMHPTYHQKRGVWATGGGPVVAGEAQLREGGGDRETRE